MPFFQVDDQAPVNRKIKRLLESALSGDVHGPAAVGLWSMSGATCQASGTDGVVTQADAIRLLLNPPLADELAHRLVDVGLWHGPGHDCPRCPAVEQGTWLFHDWFDLGYDTAEGHRTSRRKAKELKERRIIDQVWARDCVDPSDRTVAACRYCGITLYRKTTRGDTRPHLDHVDPTKAKGVRNIVLACQVCNQKKGKRTPAEAGMTLRPQPDHSRGTIDDPTALAVSPSQKAAETPQDAPGSPDTALAVSPPQGAAGTPQGAGPGTTDRTTSRTTSGPPVVSGLPARARAGTRGDAGGCAGQAGSGDGLGSVQGDPTGRPQGSAEVPPRSRRRRRRGRRRQNSRPTAQPGDQQPQTWDAGPAPEVDTPGRFGSPWHGWTGAPSDVDEETRCPTHGLHEPCRRCRDQADAEEQP